MTETSLPTAPPVRRSALLQELRVLLPIALPLAGANLAQMAMGVTDTLMVGTLGPLALAAAGLGAMLYFTTGLVLYGILSAVAPLAAHALGAGDRAGAARVAGAGFALAALLSLPFLAMLFGIAPLLRALDYDAALADAVGGFLGAITYGAPAMLIFGVQRSILAALGRTRPVMVVLVLCIAANAALNWVLIFGHFGASALGIVGSGYASAINQWLMVGGLALTMRLSPSLAGFGGWKDAVAGGVAAMASILRLGLPIGGIMALEAGVFGTAGVVMGLLGADALAANQIVINAASVTFMVPFGIGQAATVRVAFERGAQRPAAARRAAFIALGLGVGFMMLTAAVFWAVPRTIVGAYVALDDPANQGAVAIAVSLLAIAALFQVVDGAQAIAAGALRGYADTTVPMVLAGIGYWVIGFAGGWVLAFPLGLGAVGLWWGLALGLAVVAGLLTVRLWRLARA